MAKIQAEMNRLKKAATKQASGKNWYQVWSEAKDGFINDVVSELTKFLKDKEYGATVKRSAANGLSGVLGENAGKAPFRILFQFSPYDPASMEFDAQVGRQALKRKMMITDQDPKGVALQALNLLGV